MRKIYYLFGILAFVIGQPLMYFNMNLGLCILMGIVVPIVMSFINIEVIAYLMKNKGVQITYGFNIMQFLIKSIFMGLMTVIGVSVLKLNVNLYIPLLSFTWFTFHVLEAFFTQDLINREINGTNKSR